jgi:hypothetical protein
MMNTFTTDTFATLEAATRTTDLDARIAAIQAMIEHLTLEGRRVMVTGGDMDALALSNRIFTARMHWSRELDRLTYTPDYAKALTEAKRSVEYWDAAARTARDRNTMSHACDMRFICEMAVTRLTEKMA